MATPKTVSLGPFLGLNNRLPDHQLRVFRNGQPAGAYLANAVNVDLTDSGTIQRRSGTTRALAGADCHSLWGEGDAAFFVDGGALYRVYRGPTGPQATAVRDGLAPGLRLSYCRAPNGDCYWSNGLELGRLRDGVSEAAGVPTPNPAPALAAGAGGSLPAGRYQVAITALSDTDEESGATWPAQVEVPADGALTLSGVPDDGERVRVYLSSANGEHLFHAITLPAGQSSVTFQAMPALAGRCTTLGLRPMPPGQLVRFFAGRLLVASGSILYYSEPFAPTLHNPLRGFIPFASRITVIEPCDSGLWVAADKTYWLDGTDPAAMRPVEKLPYGAVEGTGGQGETDKSARWFSDRGLVVAGPGGELKNLQEDALAVARAATGATLYREQDGLRQLVTALFGTGLSGAAASSWMQMELVRKENML